VILAWMLVPRGAPRPLIEQVTLVAGLGVGMFAAQRGRPSPTEWAIGIGVMCVVATLLH